MDKMCGPSWLKLDNTKNSELLNVPRPAGSLSVTAVGFVTIASDSPAVAVNQEDPFDLSDSSVLDSLFLSHSGLTGGSA